MEVLEEKSDKFEMIVRCNNCGKPTPYGKTRMIHGFVGCDNEINVDGKTVSCFFGDLLTRVEKYKSSDDKVEYMKYHTGKVYRWRDGATE